MKATYEIYHRKHANLSVIGVSEVEESKKGIESIFQEIKIATVLNLKKEMDIQVEAVQRAPKKMNPNRHIII